MFRCKEELNSRNSLDGMNLQDRINQLVPLYMPMNLNSKNYEKKVEAIDKLLNILKHTSRHNLQGVEFEKLVQCALTVVYYFGMRLKLRDFTSKCWFWKGKRQFHKAEAAFQKTMDQLHPERSEVTIKYILKFFTEVSLWPFESFVEQILEVVLYFNRGKTTLFTLMLTDIHYALFSDVKSARHRMRVLYELLKSNNWVIDKQKLLPFVTRLLDFFVYSITRGDSNTSAYKYLKKGFEVCLRRIFERVENQHRLLVITTMLNWFSMVNMQDNDILEFSSLLDHAAELYVVGPYIESFGEGLINHILTNLVGSSNSLYSLVGCRLLETFLDRQGNAPFLLAPSIYYQFSQVRLAIGYFDSTDKAFVRHHRESIHENFLKAVRLHGYNCANLKALFSVISVIILEIPCGLTAAAGACMVMGLQDYALNGENLSVHCRYWMHAIVISVMSLICWVHKAPVLYSYVNQIIARRAKEAPQLNPPLMQVYHINRHQVTWNKPTLFFEDWELRFGLWKHFQDAQPSTRHSPTKLGKKVPIMDLGK